MDKSELVGSRVTVRNPRMGDTWTGRAVAYTDRPTLLIETDDGRRLMLPAEWAEPTPPMLREGNPNPDD